MKIQKREQKAENQSQRKTKFPGFYVLSKSGVPCFSHEGLRGMNEK